MNALLIPFQITQETTSTAQSASSSYLELEAARGAAFAVEQQEREDAGLEAEKGIGARVCGLEEREVEPAERRAEPPYKEVMVPLKAWITLWTLRAQREIESEVGEREIFFL